VEINNISVYVHYTYNDTTIQVNNSQTIGCKCTINLPLTNTIQYYNNYYKLHYYDSGYINGTIIYTAVMYTA